MTSSDSSRHSLSARSRTSFRHSRTSRSCILDSGEFANELEELPPLLALRGEDLAAFRGDLVIAAPTLSRLLDPASLNPLALFQLVERRVERREVESQRTTGSRFDQLRQLVAVSRLVFQKCEHDEFCGAFLGFTDRAGERHRRRLYSGLRNIVNTGT